MEKCFLMFSHLNLAPKKFHVKQKEIFNLYNFPRLPQNLDSKTSLNIFFLTYLLGDQLLQNLMKDSTFS